MPIINARPPKFDILDADVTVGRDYIKVKAHNPRKAGYVKIIFEYFEPENHQRIDNIFWQPYQELTDVKIILGIAQHER